MKKSVRIWAALLSILMLVLPLSACGDNPASSEPGSSSTASPSNGSDSDSSVEPSGSTDAKDTIEISVFQYKVDTIDQMQNLADMYASTLSNVKFTVETVGGSADYNVALQQKAAIDEMPDILALGSNRIPEYQERLLDLSEEPWVGNLLDDDIDDLFRVDGKLYAQPLTVEAYGFLYNKDLFEQAGITEAPKTMTELKGVCEKLSAAGITPFVNGWKESWILGNHFFNGAFLARVGADPSTYTAGLGESTNFSDEAETFSKMIDLLQLTVDYGLPNSVAEDYNTSLSDFATGKAAITMQGTWVQPTLDQMNPNLNLGAFGFILDDSEGTGVIPYGTDGGWSINKDSQNIDICKDFLTWMSESKECHQSLVDDFKFMIPFKSEVDDGTLGTVFEAFNQYKAEGLTVGWYFPLLDAALEHYVPLQEYIAGVSTAEEALEKMEKMAVDVKK